VRSTHDMPLAAKVNGPFSTESTLSGPYRFQKAVVQRFM
jgi:hypothetical protein